MGDNAQSIVEQCNKQAADVNPDDVSRSAAKLREQYPEMDGKQNPLSVAVSLSDGDLKKPTLLEGMLANNWVQATDISFEEALSCVAELRKKEPDFDWESTDTLDIGRAAHELNDILSPIVIDYLEGRDRKANSSLVPSMLG